MNSATLWELLLQVGWTMVPIYVLSIFVVAVAIRKLLDFHAARLGDTKWFEGVLSELREGRPEDALALAEASRHPAGAVVAGTLRALDEQPEQADNEARRLGLEQIARLERNMSPLALCAEIAPLLGLLGTVLGMVGAFQSLSLSSGSSHEELASSISLALVTTLMGLVLAIPCIALFTLFRNRIDALGSEAGSEIERLVLHLEAAGPSGSEANQAARHPARPESAPQGASAS